MPEAHSEVTLEGPNPPQVTIGDPTPDASLVECTNALEGGLIQLVCGTCKVIIRQMYMNIEDLKYLISNGDHFSLGIPGLHGY